MFNTSNGDITWIDKASCEHCYKTLRRWKGIFGEQSREKVEISTHDKHSMTDGIGKFEAFSCELYLEISI